MIKMKVRKNWLVLIVFSLIIIFLPGCWSHRELHEIGIASGIGFDLNEEGKIALSVQIITPSPFSKQTERGDRKPVRVLTSEGETVFDAIRNIMAKSGDRGFYPHLQIIVFGEDLAKAGLKPVLDFLERDPEIRVLTWLTITEGKAEDIIRGHSREDDTPATHINRLIEDYRATSRVTPTSLLNYIDMSLKEGIEPIIGKVSYFEEKGEPTFFMEEAGVFKGDRLVGWLDAHENRGYLWVANKVQSGIVVAQRKNQEQQKKKNTSPNSSNHFEDLISFEILRSKSKMKPQLNDDELSFLIELEVVANIGERMDNESAAGKEFINEMEELLRLSVEKEILDTLKKAQKEFNSDIFGFGLATKRKYPEYWQEHKEEWDEIFPELEVELKVKTKINAPGMIL